MHGLILEMMHNHLEVRALPKTERQQVQAWAGRHVGRDERLWLPGGQATAGARMTEALDERGRCLYQSLSGKQSTKPLKQSGCVAPASLRS